MRTEATGRYWKLALVGTFVLIGIGWALDVAVVAGVGIVGALVAAVGAWITSG